jgi:hypothetical protein
MAGFEKGKKYEVVDAEQGDCIGCCFHIEGVCNLDITIPCRKDFIFKEVKRMEQKFIIGDLAKVILDDEEQVVKVIGYDPTYKRYLLANEYIDETRGCISVAEDRIMPIPLTPEFFKKNGWKKFKRPYSRDYCYRRKGAPTLNIRSEKEVYFHWGDHDKSITTVHQLQHLLFGLGLNSEMEV